MNKKLSSMFLLLAILAPAFAVIYDLRSETTLSTNEIVVGGDFFSFASLFFGSGNEQQLDTMPMAVDIQYPNSVIGILEGAKWGISCPNDVDLSKNSCVSQGDSLEAKAYRGSTFNVQKSSVYVKFDNFTKFEIGNSYFSIF